MKMQNEESKGFFFVQYLFQIISKFNVGAVSYFIFVQSQHMPLRLDINAMQKKREPFRNTTRI